MFLHVLVCRGPESENCTESSLLGCKGLVEVCDLELFACRTSRIDLGAILGGVLYGVCSTCEEIATGTGVPIAQAYDWVGNGVHQDVLREIPFLPGVCLSRTSAYVAILQYAGY